jgi:hypothetical protein
LLTGDAVRRRDLSLQIQQIHLLHQAKNLTQQSASVRGKVSCCFKNLCNGDVLCIFFSTQWADAWGVAADTTNTEL